MMINEIKNKDQVQEFLDRLYNPRGKRKEGQDEPQELIINNNSKQSRRIKELLEMQQEGEIKELEINKKITIMNYGCNCQTYDAVMGYKKKERKSSNKITFVASAFYFDKKTNKYVIEDVISDRNPKNSLYSLRRKIIVRHMSNDTIFREISDEVRKDWSK